MLVNGILAGSEIAVVSLRKTRLKELVEGGSSAARAVQALREHPERFLATVQIGITVVSATASAFGGATLAKHLEPIFQGVPALAPYAEEAALAIVVAIVSYLSLVLGELVPKSLALRTSEQYAMVVGRPLVGLSTIARPLVWFLTASSNVVLRIFGDRTNFIESRLSSEELQQLVGEAAKAGTVHPHAGEIAARALIFGELTAADVMVPRNRVVAIAKGVDQEELRRILLEETHTRLPVYEGRIDNVVGYISVKDVIALAWEHKLIVLEDLLRPAFFVPEVKPAVDLLQEMRKQRHPLAIVVDERGGLAGIVTLEDLVEELVGEIFSEHEEQVPELIKKEADGSYRVLANVPIRDVNRELGVELPEDGDWTTVAGLCLSLARHIPSVGETVTTDNGYVLEVLDASPRRIRAVRLRPPGAPDLRSPR